MKIIILGSGKVGRIIAQAFSNDLHELIIIDKNKKNLELINETLDVLTINENEISLPVLYQAGAEDADMLVAASELDEVNLLASVYAKQIFKIPYRIARIRNQDNYEWRDTLFHNNIIPANLVLYPEHIVARHLFDLINYHGVNSINFLADNQFAVYEITANYGGRVVGKSIIDFVEEFRRLGVFVISVKRQGVHLNIYGHTSIESLDQVLVICPVDNVLPSLSLFIRPQNKPRRIIISGSGRLGMVLAQKLAMHDFEFKIFEPDAERARKITSQLELATVIQAPISNQEVLFNEGIENCDLFISIHPNGEDNIINCLLAKKMGAKKVISLLDNLSYRDILNIEDIDIAVSMAIPMSTIVKSHSLFSNIKKIITINHDTELYEFSIEGDEHSSKLINKKIKDLIKALPSSNQFAGLIRNNHIYGYDSELIIQVKDRIMIYVMNKRHLVNLIKLFSFSEDFF